MDKKAILILLIILIAVTAFYLWGETKIPQDKEGVEEFVAYYEGNQMERAITEYLLNQKQFGWKTKDNSQNFCVVESLDPEKELFPLYFWTYCGEYILDGDWVKTLSGSSGPVKIDYPNELSFYNPNRFSYEAPGDGSHYSEDIKIIFPELVQERIFNFDRKEIISRAEKIAFINMMSWELIKSAINNCEAESIFQAHNRNVAAELKNGEKLFFIEPQIDDIFELVKSAEPRCGKILMATE